MKIKIYRNNYIIDFFYIFHNTLFNLCKEFSFVSFPFINLNLSNESKQNDQNVCKFSNSFTPFLAVATEYKFNKKKMWTTI